MSIVYCNNKLNVFKKAFEIKLNKYRNTSFIFYFFKILKYDFALVRLEFF